jgi:hypothetical protein
MLQWMKQTVCCMLDICTSCRLQAAAEPQHVLLLLETNRATL